VTLEGNHVYLVFEYLTGDASGQNMVTIATNAVFEFIMQHSPIEPEYAFLDGNLSGDKRPTATYCAVFAEKKSPLKSI
jgi:hydroxymethylglutaryl-CoA reductase (NADPH)